MKMSHGEVVACYWWTAKDAEGCTWPRKKPVMPSYPGDTADYEESIASYAFALAITKFRKEIEVYWKALDEFNGVTK